MRVIAGSCRSMPLKTVRGTDTRPTTDRIKETLFNILMPYIPGCSFLDLFAGSGGIGIEALSRGAARCCFVDSSRQAAAVIRENLAFTRLDSKARVIQADAEQAVRRLAKEEPFDVIFLDPPYDRGLEARVLPALCESGCAADGALFIVEASLETDFSWAGHAGFEIIRYKKYKTNQHVFLKIRDN